MPIGSKGEGGDGGGGAVNLIYPEWKSDTDGGVYAINNQISFDGNTYRNLTGVNTDTTPDNDSVNWVKVQIVSLTQAEFDALVLAGDDQADIFYDITDAPVLRIETVFTVADIAARDALTLQQEGDTARVLDNGTGGPEMFIWNGTAWLNYPPANVALSAGMLIKPTFTITGTDLIIDAGGVAQLYTSTAQDAAILRHDVPGQTVDLSTMADGDTAQVLVRDNDGTIEYFLNTGVPTNEIVEALAFAVADLDGNFEVDRFDNAYALANFINNRNLATDRVRRPEIDGGLEISNPLDDEIEIAVGIIWVGNEDRSLAIVNSSSAATLQYDGLGDGIVVTGFNNDQFVDAGGNLQTLTANRYAINWIYRIISDETNTARIVVLLGGGDHQLAAAQQELFPTYSDSVPILQRLGELVGKMIVLKGAASPVSIEDVGRDGRLINFIPVAVDATLTGDGTAANPLSVVGAGGGVNNVDYINAFSAANQSLAAANAWEDIIFSTNGPLDGWTHTPGTSDFICPANGTYDFDLVAYVSKVSGGDDVAATRGVINGVEIPGSATAKNIVHNDRALPFPTRFSTPMTVGQVFKAQLSGGADNVEIMSEALPVGAAAGVSVMINIIRRA